MIYTYVMTLFTQIFSFSFKLGQQSNDGGRPKIQFAFRPKVYLPIGYLPVAIACTEFKLFSGVMNTFYLKIFKRRIYNYMSS